MKRDDVAEWIRSNTSLSFVRSGGPGGQNVNKVNTKVVATLPIDEESPLSEEETARLTSRLANRINSEGRLVVQSQRGRTQGENRKRAMSKLEHLVLQSITPPRTRRPTRPTKRANERRLQQKRSRAEKKQRRSWRRDRGEE